MSNTSKSGQNPTDLAPPRPDAVPTEDVRRQWLDSAHSNFVHPGGSNRAYYLAVLEYLWPEGHGVPGPHRSEDDVRRVINDRRRQLKPGKADYRDPFRRVRELQGEEGFVGIVHKGKTVQLVSLHVASKRIPRSPLAPEDKRTVFERDHRRCTVCGRGEDVATLELDHRVPRLRGGGPEISNWQVLCGECNNHKSTQCRGCEQECAQCPWAFPEQHGLIRISTRNVTRARSAAAVKGVNVHDMVNELLSNVLEDSEPSVE